MAISTKYTDTQQTIAYEGRGTVNKSTTFSASVSDYFNKFSGSFDNGFIYTMCTDDSINTATAIVTETYKKKEIKIETKKTQGTNAVFFGITDSAWNINRMAYDRGSYYGNTCRVSCNPSFNRHYLVCYIGAIRKTDITDDTAISSDSYFFPRNKVQQITVKELNEHKDEYIVTDIQIRPMMTASSSTSSNRYDISNYMSGFINELGMTAVGLNSIFNQATINLSNVEMSINTVPYYIGSIESGPMFNNKMWYAGDDFEYGNNFYNIPIPDVNLTASDIQDGIHYHTFTNGDGVMYVRTVQNVANEVDSTAVKLCFTGEWIIKKIASFGLNVLYDSTDYTVIEQGVISVDNPHIAIGYMNSDGFTSGVLVTPFEKADSDTKNKNFAKGYESDVDPNNYRPIKPDSKTIDPSIFGNYECKSGGVRYYGMTSNQYFEFNRWINGDLESGYEPLKSVVYFAYQPFRSDTTFMTDQDNVKIGGKSSVQMKPLNKSTSRYFLGSYNVKRIHNNFLDYSPYTDITVYIPLCGEIVLPTNVVMGNTIKTYLLTDSQTGGCTGYVTTIVNGNEIIVGHRTGQFVQNMPLSSNEVGLRKQAETQSLMSLGGSAVATGLGIATGNPLAIVGGVGGLIASTVNGILSSNTNRSQSTGALSDVINFNMPLQCYIRITSPYTDINANYGHNTGYMCNKVKQIADCNGYTVCTNIDTSGLTCTETEKEMIKNALENGCYL